MYVCMYVCMYVLNNCIKPLYFLTVHGMVCFYSLERDQLYKNKRSFASPSYCSYHDLTARNPRNALQLKISRIK